jgi:2-keto-4-pentenoate hydratase/2-oxohepta-3-ene-1,7-dioic acid hydratase in catechol pathway
MRLARVETAQGHVTGEYRDGAVVTDDDRHEVGAIADLAAPCEPSACYCVGRNYAATIDSMGSERPDEPDFFIKPPASVVGPGDPVPYPAFSGEVTYAGELAAVIGERCRDVAPADVPAVVRGYTIMNDVDALDQGSRTARKAFDASGPLGPWIETDVDPTAIEMHTDVAGERRQAASTEQMLFDPYEVVAYLSERFVLRPGDVVAFGSPDNPGLVEPGDEVAITYEGIGTLRNRITPPR